MDIPVEAGNVLTDRIDGLAFVGYLVVDNHQVLQTFLDVALVGLQLTFLFLDLFTHLSLLRLQRLHRRGGSFLGRSLFCGCFLCLGFLDWCLFLRRRNTGSGCPLLHSLLLRLLGGDNHHHTDHEPE